MQLVMKYFKELSLDELYDILSSRSAVFVVEQRCAYQDPDDIDRKALHLFFREQNQIKAYLRLFKKDDHTVQIDRLFSLERNQGLARKLLSAGIKASCQFSGDRLYLEAPLQARALYEKEGFTQEGETFEQGGMFHIAMVRSYHC